MKNIFKKKKKYKMDLTLANETLQNVFTACEKTPNTIPFDKILLRQKPNTRVFTCGKWIAIFMLVLTFLMPLAFSPSPAKISKVSSAGTHLSISNHFVKDKTLYLQFDGNNINLSNTYMLTISDEKIYPLSYDEEKNMISFPYLNEEVNIYIVTDDSSSMQILVTPKK